MKYIVGLYLLILFTILTSADTCAQEKTETNKPENTFNFYFINGYAISYNFYEAKSYYLRAQLDLSTSKEDIDSDGESIQYYTGSTENYSTSDNHDNSYFLIGASVQIVFPIYVTKYGNIYLGAGPVFTYATRNYSSSRTQTNPDPTYSPVTSTSSTGEQNYDVAAIVLLGVKGIITENISLFVEANIKGGGRWQNSEGEYSNTDPSGYQYKNTYSSDGNGWFYEAQFIRMGVSISL
jgi:hypothetical protein